MAIPSGSAFVRSVMNALGSEGPTDLARAMKWGHHTPRNISRWLKGESSPDYLSTMQMLDRCGWLNMSESAPASDPEDLLGGIAAGVDELVLGQRDLFEHLGVPGNQVEPSVDQPRRRRAARRAKKK